MLDNLPWHALNTEHARFALCAPAARKYPADVTPFCGTPDNSAQSLQQIIPLLNPDETTYVMADALPAISGLTLGEPLPVFQMLAAEIPKAAPPDRCLVSLFAEDAPAMMKLTDLAFPGFFRPRTCEMGVYYGIRIDGELVAMAGERLALPDYREISGVCTHPAHTGKGYAAGLVAHLMQEHAWKGLHSILQVGCANTRAIALYKRLGFCVRKETRLYPLSRSA
jgi:GNAT superfamily N-acetyltransferase